MVKRLGPEASRALEGYTFESIECGNCTPGELNEVILSLMEGDAALTGAAVSEIIQPLQAALQGQSASGGREAAPEEAPELQVEFAEPDKPQQAEWNGYATSVKNKAPVFYAIKTQKAWETLWAAFSSEDTPKVDFQEKTIIGIVAGSGNKAETVRIIARRQAGDATVFDYYMTEASADNPAVPYLFRTFDKVEGKVEFKRLDTERKEGEIDDIRDGEK